MNPTKKFWQGSLWLFDNNEASIANIAVDPKFQGLGIGGALMRFAELKAKEKNISTLNLATHILLEENISLYRYLGWEPSIYEKKCGVLENITSQWPDKQLKLCF